MKYAVWKSGEVLGVQPIFTLYNLCHSLQLHSQNLVPKAHKSIRHGPVLMRYRILWENSKHEWKHAEILKLQFHCEVLPVFIMVNLFWLVFKIWVYRCARTSFNISGWYFDFCFDSLFAFIKARFCFFHFAFWNLISFSLPVIVLFTQTNLGSLFQFPSEYPRICRFLYSRYS